MTGKTQAAELSFAEPEMIKSQSERLKNNADEYALCIG